MAQEPKKRLLGVRINRNGKSLMFSTKASAPLAGYTDVDVLEKGSVIAVRGNCQGNYHISGEQGRSRKALSNAQLVSYFCEKFGCEPGANLSAWMGGEENVLFFGAMQPGESAYFLDDEFTPVEVGYNRRAGDWAYVHDNWIEFTREVRKALPTRMSAYRCGRVVLLSGDSRGALTMTARRQSATDMLVSRALADHLRSLYGGAKSGMRLRATIMPGGVALADEPETLAAADLTRPERLALDESKHCFITLGTKGTIYLSALAWKRMEEPERLALYGAPGCLALHAEPKGALRVTRFKYGHHIHSKKLYQMMRTQWPGAERLCLLRYGDLWLLWPNAAHSADVPPRSVFQRLGQTDNPVARKMPTPQQVAAAEERTTYGL